MRILTGFRGEIARFVILGARCQGVNHLRVPLCPEVTHFEGEFVRNELGTSPVMNSVVLMVVLLDDKR